MNLHYLLALPVCSEPMHVWFSLRLEKTMKPGVFHAGSGNVDLKYLCIISLFRFNFNWEGQGLWSKCSKWTCFHACHYHISNIFYIFFFPKSLYVLSIQVSAPTSVLLKATLFFPKRNASPFHSCWDSCVWTNIKDLQAELFFQCLIEWGKFIKYLFMSSSYLTNRGA